MLIVMVGAVTMTILEKEGIVELRASDRTLEKIACLEAEIKALQSNIASSKATIDKMNTIDAALVSEVAKFIKTSGQNEISSLTQSLSKINDLSEKVENLEQRTNDLGSALNPTTPKEVLTLARLGDCVRDLDTKLIDLTKSFESLKKEMSIEVYRNHELVVKEIDRIVGLFQWLGLLLIPIILNTIRDIFRPKQNSSNTGEHA
ncbi:hypothetical protein [Aeromonas diversa]|uniref:hypothetical protein n=1 Tax=Aeromonas diversa TaxID=502790 RepID=UPI003461B575